MGRVACQYAPEKCACVRVCERVCVTPGGSQGAEERTRGGDSLGIACGHQMFTCYKKKGEGVERKKKRI